MLKKARTGNGQSTPSTSDTLKTWKKEPVLGLLVPYASESLSGRGGSESGNVTVYGTTTDYYEIQGLQLAMGRWLKISDMNQNTYACVLNETAAAERIGYTDCVDQAITLNNVRFTVVGVLKDDDHNLTSVFSSGSMVAYVSYNTLLRLSTTATSDITTFYVSAAEGNTTEAAKTTMTRLLMERFDQDEDAFSVSSQDALETTMISVTSMFTVMLGGIAAISLVAGASES